VGLIAFVSGRWLGGLRRRTHVAAVSAISMGAMALGALALVVTLALLEGFQSTIRQQLADSGFHAELRPRSGPTLPGGTWLDDIRRRHPELAVRARRSGAVWCVAGGAALPAELEVQDTLSRVEVNRVLAARLQAGVGSELTVVSPRLQLTPLGPAGIRRHAVIGAVTRIQPGEERAIVTAPPGLGEALIEGRAPSSVELRDADSSRAFSVASRVQDELPDGVDVVSFAELNRPLLAALSLERVMIGLGVALVLVVAGLNLLCNLALLAAEKRSDVAVLVALGLTPQRVFALLLTLGTAIGALGATIGAALGGLIAVVLDRSQALPLPAGVFIVSHVPFRVTAGMLVAVWGIAFVIALLASVVPAWAAARRGCLEGLRYE